MAPKPLYNWLDWWNTRRSSWGSIRGKAFAQSAWADARVGAPAEINVVGPAGWISRRVAVERQVDPAVVALADGSGTRLSSALDSVWGELQSRASSVDFVALLQQVFGPGRETTAQALADRLASGDQLGLRFELLSGSVMGSAAGAYAAAGPDGQPTVYINVDWLKGASHEQLHLVLLEEISHGFDTVLNGGVDTAGDEGEQFSKLFSGIALDPDQLNQIATQDDRTVLTIRGQSVTVEQDNVTTVGAVSFSSDTGSSSSDRTTRTQSQTITATTTTNNSGNNTPTLFVSTNSGTTRTLGTISGWTDNGGSATFTFNNISLVSGSNSLTFWTAATGGTAVNTTDYILDTTAPTVSSVAITSATGAQNSTLNAGDVVSATVTMSESVTVTGTPQLTLNIGGVNRIASYSSGSGTSALVFTYTIAAGDTDANGIAIAANSLALNSGTIADTAGNAATITHSAVADNASYRVDTAAPAAPTLALGTGISGGATSSEATAAGGVVTVTAESGSSVAVVFTRGANSVTKTVTGNGATPVAVVLASADLTTLGNGTIAVSATATDAAGNASSAGTTSFTLDTAAPTVSSVAITSATGAQNSTLNAGDVVSATVTMSESVTVTGTPQLTLNIGGVNRIASYSSGSGTSALVFTYTIAAGDTDANGIAIAANSLALNSGTIADTAGNAATITHSAAADNASYRVDTAAPAAPTLALGTGISGGATSSEATAAGGVVTVTAESGSSVAVVFTRGANSVTKTVTGNGATPVAVVLASADLTTLGNGTIAVSATATDAAGNASSAGTTSFTLDTAAPTVSSVAITSATGAQNSTLNAGDVVSATVTMSESVTVTGTPQLTLNIGGVNRIASYSSGSGTSALVFTYTIAAGDTDANGIAIAANSLALNSGTIADTAGNAATITHSAAADNASYRVDTAAPAAPTLALGTGISGGATSSEATAAGGVVTVTAESGSSVAVVFTRGANSVTKTVTGNGATPVAVVLASADLTTLGNGTIAVSATATDAAGNASSAGTTSFTLDTAAPTVSSVAITSATGAQNSTLNAGDVVSATVTMSESVTVTGTPQLTLNIGGVNRIASYSSGSGTSALVFTYTIAAGDTDANGIAIAANSLALNSGTIADTAGNAATITHSAAADNASYRVDTAAPAAPTLALAADTGTSATDRLTTNASLNVAGLESGASWDYSTNSGTSWTPGSGSSFSVDAASYTAGQVQVRQTDLAGNLGTANTTFAAFTVDNTAPNTPSIASVLDNVGTIQGALASGGSSNDNNLTVRVGLAGTNAAPGDSIQLHNGLTPLGTAYSITAGDISNGYADVATGTLTDAITYQISAKLTDAAGNASTASSPFVITIDTAAPAAPALALGGGVVNGATAAEASQLSGVVTVNAENQSTVAVSFTRSGGGTVTQTLIGNGTAQALSLSAAEVASLGDGLISVSATATDAAGNSSGASSTSFTLDTSAPSALGLTPPADNGVNTSDGITTLNTFTISALETGAIWEFSADAGTTWSAGSGTTFTAPDGSYGAGDIQVRQIDLAGNAGPISANSSSITINANGAGPTIAAISPAIAQTATPLNSGIVISFSEAIYANGGTLTIQNGNGTNNNLYRMTLTSSQSSGSFSLGSGTWFIAGNKLYIDPDQNFSSNLTFNIDISGSALVNASGIGNTTITSSSSNNYRFTTGATGTLDSQAPVITVASLAFSADSFGVGTAGTSSDFITSTASQTIRGALSSTLATDELVQVSLDNGVTWRFADASAGNAFELSGVVLTGSNILRARVIDGAGNAGTSWTQAYVLDTTAPGPVTLALQSDTGSSLRDGITSNANLLVSQLATDASWQVSTDGGDSWSTASGSSLSLAPGSYNASQVQVRQIDLAGNLSGVAANSRTWVVDTTAPQFLSSGTAAPIAENSGSNQLIYTPQMAATEMLTGSLIFYSLAGGSDAALFSVDTFSGDVHLLVNPDYESHTSYNLILRATDLAGLSTDQAVTLAILDRDELAPLAPVFNAIAGDQRINALEAAEGVVISGSAEGGSTVTISWGSVSQTVTTSGTPSGSGTWSTNFSVLDLPADGLSTITATASDAAGNGSVTGSTSVELDQTTPGQPSLSPVAGNNRINAAEKTAGITLTGSAEAGAAIAISWNGSTRTTTADATTGAWSLDYATAQIPADTTNSLITVTATDRAGNVSSPFTRSVVIDTAPPVAPLINTVAGNDIVNAAEKAAGITLSGTGEIGTTASISWGSFATSTTVNSSGIWSVLVSSGSVPVDNATSSVSVTLTDAAGNISAPGMRAVRIDTGAPLAPVINAVAGDNTINAAEKAAGLTLSGSTDAENGSTVAITWGNVSRTATVSGGTWSLAYTSAQIPADGSSTITAVVTDTAGNSSAPRTSPVVIDTVAPALTIASLRFGDAVTGGGSTDTGVIKNDFITSTGLQTLNGSLSAVLGAGDTVWVRLNSGGTTGTWSQASASGTTFSASLNLGAADNSGSFDVQVRDAAGNPGATRNQTYRLDTAAAGVTISTFALSADTGVAGDRITSAANQTISGTLSTPIAAGESVWYSLNGGGWTQASTTTGRNTWSFSGTLSTANGGVNSIAVRHQDIAGNASAASTYSVTYDATAPTLSSLVLASGGADNLYGRGDVVTVTATFSESVLITGTPRVALNVGGVTKYATYSAGNNSNTLTFSYTVAAGDSDANGISLAANALQLNQGTIRDAAGTNALIGYTPIPNPDQANAAVDSSVSFTELCQLSESNIQLDTITNHARLVGLADAAISGDDGNNVLTGNAGNNVITGGLGRDILTGGLGADRFLFNQPTDSQLGSGTTGMDWIRDWEIGIDIIVSPWGSETQQAQWVGSVTKLTSASVAQLLNTTTFSANVSAAAFTLADGSTMRTFLALNNGTSGFDASNDVLLEITGYQGGF